MQQQIQKSYVTSSSPEARILFDNDTWLGYKSSIKARESSSTPAHHFGVNLTASVSSAVIK